MNADFKKLMSARFLFTFAVQMQAVVLGWRMYELTKNPLFLGLIGLVEAIPALSLALYAGLLVDRGRPLWIYRAVVAASFISGLVLLISQFERSLLNESQQVLALFLSSLITGIARGFSQPSVFAIVPRIVPRAELQKASAWMSSAMQVARIGGPAAGGIIFGWFGMITTAALICLFLILAQVALALISTARIPRSAPLKKNSLKEDLLSGASFVFRHPILFPALTLDMVSVLFGGVTALLPIYAAEILHVGPKGVGLLRGAPAVGAALTSLWLTRLDVREKAGPWLFTAVTGFGACILIFAISQNFWLSAVALGLSGAFDSVSMVIRTAAVQLASPDSMRGRISAVNSMFIGSSNELGEFESGIAAKALGTVPSAIFGGLICLLTVGVVAWRFPTLRRLNLKELEAQHLN